MNVGKFSKGERPRFYSESNEQDFVFAYIHY